MAQSPNSFHEDVIYFADWDDPTTDIDTGLFLNQELLIREGVSTVGGFVASPNGSQGNLCLAGSIGRYVGAGQIQNSGPPWSQDNPTARRITPRALVNGLAR